VLRIGNKHIFFKALQAFAAAGDRLYRSVRRTLNDQIITSNWVAEGRLRRRISQ
jgi:hypothetical protein